MIESEGWLFSYNPVNKTPNSIDELLNYRSDTSVLRCLPIYDQAVASGRLKMFGTEMKWAEKNYHDLSYLLMQALDEHGLRPILIKKYNIVGFPVGKTIGRISLSLVDKNSKLLRYYAKEWNYVIIPRMETPQCKWETIKNIFDKNLPDDKFIVVHSYKDDDV